MRAGPAADAWLHRRYHIGRKISRIRHSIELAAAIFGNCDQNVKLLENEFHVTAVCRGSLLKFTGEPKDVEAAVHAVDGMVTLMQNHTPLEEQTVRFTASAWPAAARKSACGN